MCFMNKSTHYHQSAIQYGMSMLDAYKIKLLSIYDPSLENGRRVVRDSHVASRSCLYRSLHQIPRCILILISRSVCRGFIPLGV